MLHLLHPIPPNPCIAVSGGPDSMAALDFVRKSKHYKDTTVLFFNHGTEFSNIGEKFIIKYCNDNYINFEIGSISREKYLDESLEEYWRNERLAFFSRYPNVITGHHLDDAVETWLFTSMHGKGRIIPVTSRNIIHPFLLNRKSQMLDWCSRKGVEYLTDPSNSDISYRRNYIRHNLLPCALEINPGLFKVIRKKYLRGEVDEE